MGYSIEGQSPNDVENIRQRVNLQRQVGQLNQDMRKTSVINPRLTAIQNLLQRSLDQQLNIDQVYEINNNIQEYINFRFNECNDQIYHLLSLFDENIVEQTDLDEIYKYVKNTRANVNKKLNALKKQVEEQDKKLDKILELLEVKDE